MTSAKSARSYTAVLGSDLTRSRLIEIDFACNHVALRDLLGRAHRSLEVVDKVKTFTVKLYRHKNGNRFARSLRIEQRPQQQTSSAWNLFTRWILYRPKNREFGKDCRLFRVALLGSFCLGLPLSNADLTSKLNIYLAILTIF